jgi:hypothetical protein
VRNVVAVPRTTVTLAIPPRRLATRANFITTRPLWAGGPLRVRKRHNLLRLPAAKSTTEDMGKIVPRADTRKPGKLMPLLVGDAKDRARIDRTGVTCSLYTVAGSVLANRRGLIQIKVSLAPTPYGCLDPPRGEGAGSR